MEWLRDATNASQQEDSLLNKGLNNSFLNCNRRFFSEVKIPFDTFVIRQTQITPNDSQWRISETVWHRSISEI